MRAHAPTDPVSSGVLDAGSGLGGGLVGAVWPPGGREHRAIVADRLGVELGGPLPELHERAVVVGQRGPYQVGLVLPDGLVLEHLLVDLANERRSEEHTSELQSLMRISYDVCCLKK